MDRKIALILLIILTAFYILMVWVTDYFGPGAQILFSVLYGIVCMLLLGNIFPKKSKKKKK